MIARQTILAFALVTGLSTGGAAAAAPSMEVGSEKLVITGITPSGSVVLFGFGRGRGPTGGITVLHTEVLVSDHDGDGRIEFAPPYPIPVRSVWAAVDFDSGEYTIAGRRGYTVAQRVAPVHRLTRDREGGAAFLEQERSRIALLFVRPRTGAWFHIAQNGGRNDADQSRHDNKLTLAFGNGASVLPNAAGKAPVHLQKGDVVIGVDPGRLDVFAFAAGK